MKAAVFERYGGPEVLELKDVPRPRPGKGEVLVKVKTASINDWDWQALGVVLETPRPVCPLPGWRSRA